MNDQAYIFEKKISDKPEPTISNRQLKDIKQQLDQFLDDEESNYPDAVDGDIYLNPSFGDMWIVDGDTFVKINDGYTMDLDDTYDFIKVGHVDGVINKTRD